MSKRLRGRDSGFNDQLRATVRKAEFNVVSNYGTPLGESKYTGPVEERQDLA
ncbi:hypothetical protein BH23GEM6_BH23GEM6_15260 [soil metagenome]